MGIDFCWGTFWSFGVILAPKKISSKRREERGEEDVQGVILLLFSGFWSMFFLCFGYSSRRNVVALTRSPNEQESNELSGSRGEANFVWKCKSCKVFRSSFASYHCSHDRLCALSKT